MYMCTCVKACTLKEKRKKPKICFFGKLLDYLERNKNTEEQIDSDVLNRDKTEVLTSAVINPLTLPVSEKVMFALLPSEGTNRNIRLAHSVS